MKNNMLCDLETGICGPTGENAPTMEFIDLSAPQKKVKPINEEQKDIKISSGYSTADHTNLPHK